MWFKVNVRLSEVTDLKWPHGIEWQCGNSTLAMSWPNHVQILSFASMASRQVAVKHGFVSKIAGGCSSYDVIAPWPDLTWSIFLPKVAQGLPHKVPQNPAALRAAVFTLSAKKFREGGVAPTPLSGRGLTRGPAEVVHETYKAKSLSESKELIHSLHILFYRLHKLKQMRAQEHNMERKEILCARRVIGLNPLMMHEGIFFFSNRYYQSTFLSTVLSKQP